MTLGNWLQEWIAVYAPVRCSSGVTLERYQRLANYLLHGATHDLAALSATSLAELKHQQIESALIRLTGVRSARKDHLSKRSVRHIGALLSASLQKACRLDLLAVNPMKLVELPTPEAPRARSLTLDEVRQLRTVCRGDWTGVFVDVALATGCRRGELLAFEWADLDHRTRSLAVVKALEQTREGLRLKMPKNGRGRALTLPYATVSLLRRAGQSKHGLMFPGHDGRWMSPALVSQLIVRKMQKAGIPDASLHSLRHTHATALLSRGVPVSAVSQRLGHADANITLRTYCHAMPLDDHRVADEWDRIAAELRG